MFCCTAPSRLSRLSRAAVAPAVGPAHKRAVAVRYQSDNNKAPWLDLPVESNYSIAEKNAVLTRAEDELGEFCNRLTDPAKASECWSTYQYLKQKHIASLRGCASEVQSGAPSASCANLEQLDQMIRELESSGQIETLYHVLSLMKKMEAGETAQAAQAASAEPGRSCKWDADGAHLQCEAERLFQAADTNGDGKIDVAEFRVAMAHISKDLTGDEVAQICECLDIHGSIEKQQFVDIVMAERARLQDPESDAEFLRHLAHRHSRSSIHLDSTWQ